MKTGLDAKYMSREAKAACKALHMTPRYFETLNSGQSVESLNDNQGIVRVWNSKREIVLTKFDMDYANRYLV